MTHTKTTARLVIGLTIVATALGLAVTPAAAAPALVVSPATGLLDRQVVTVTGSGFAANEELLITQCIGSVPERCDMNPVVNQNGAYARADGSGVVTATVRLERQLVLPAGQTGGGCQDGDCSIVAVSRVDGAERARTAIDFEPTGTAPPLPAPSVHIETTELRPTGSTVEVTGSGFQPWFQAQPFWYGEDLTIDLASGIGSGPGAYLALCLPGDDGAWTGCERYLGPAIDSPGTPVHGAREPIIVDVRPDGTLEPTTLDLRRVWTFAGARVDCAVEECTFVLEQDAPIGPGDPVDWASEAAPWPSDLALIEDAYAALLGRAPLDDEIAYLRDQLRERELTGRAFLLGLADSSDGRRVAELVRLYRAALDRRPDAAGLTYWAGELVANGGNMSAIARAFGRTSEFRTSFGSGSNAVAVARAYQRTLGRNPSVGDTAYWVGRLDAGLARTHMIHLFSRTPEYVHREGPRSLVTAVYHALLGKVPTAEQWERMAIDYDPNHPNDPWPEEVRPHAWRIEDVMLELIASPDLAAAVA